MSETNQDKLIMVYDRISVKHIEMLNALAAEEKIPVAVVFRKIIDKYSPFLLSQNKEKQKKIQLSSRLAVKVVARYMYARQVETLNMIAQENQLHRSIVLREILDKYYEVYLHRRGTFNCQKCGKLTKNKYRHDIPVENEVFAFGDCCYFNDSYKDFIRQII